jgi:hypothetical protein
MIITRLITKDRSDVGSGINTKLAARQHDKYRDAARY